MKEKLLIEIDNYIEEARNSKDHKLYTDGFSRLIVQYFDDVKFDKASLPKAILYKELPNNCQKFVAYCMLRILNHNIKIIEFDRYFKVLVLALFDNCLNEVYNLLHINEKTESYIKEAKLSDYIKTREKEILDNINFTGDIQVIGKYESRFRKTINKPENKALLKCFVNFDVFQIKYDKLFKELTQYSSSLSINKYDLYNQIIKTLDELILEFKNIGTKYSKDYFENQFKKIKDLILADFLDSPYTKSADLEVKETEKKYPLSITNVKNQFELKVLNNSDGSAFKTTLRIKDYNSQEIDIPITSQYIGTINTTSINVEFEYQVKIPTKNLVLDCELIWSSFDNKVASKQFLIELKGQDTNINWKQLEEATPYDLEAVETENQLIGRDNILNQLKLRTKEKLVSSYIYGQRRVGKTSIVKTLKTVENKPESLLIIYLEAGDWNDAQSPGSSMDNLGRKICDRIKNANYKFNHIKTPSFHGSLTKLTDFLDDISELDKCFKVLIILDEFDRISKDLQKRGDIGLSFMSTLRAISNRPHFGFILVGGEKLEYILSQWQEFNKFKPVRVDYFDKEDGWDDFKKLIRLPVEGKLDVSDKAIDYIYNQTSGNPYFTKLICIELYSFMVKNRDRHVTEKEAIKATEIARNSSNIGATDFSHFWEDGIKEKAEKEEEVSINRRKVLISISEIIKLNESPNKELIVLRSMDKGLTEETSLRILEEFEQRKIIKLENGSYGFIVRFFEDWLITDGIEKLMTTFEEEERVVLRKKMEDEQRIKNQEILDLLKSWKTFKGQEITSEKVRCWLDQFDDLHHQKLMFHILKNTTFYNEIVIRQKLEILFTEVLKELRKSDTARIIQEGKLKREDIIVSYLDSNPAKSGAEYAKLFVEVNNIYKENSTDPSRIRTKVESINNLRAIVFIDDMVGTGRSVIENIEQNILVYNDLFLEMNITIIIGLVTGFLESVDKIEKFLIKNELNAFVKIIDPLSESDKCFSENSRIFPQSIQRKQARDICYHQGLKLEPNNPLGFGDCQATIVFPHSCPNNSLPILWKETKDWKPLFKR
jgi:hypothetical protein